VIVVKARSLPLNGMPERCITWPYPQTLERLKGWAGISSTLADYDYSRKRFNDIFHRSKSNAQDHLMKLLKIDPRNIVRMYSYCRFSTSRMDPMFVDKLVLVTWHAGVVSLPSGDVIFE
jgi:hypothetical protein